MKGRSATHACYIVWMFTQPGTGEDRAGARQLSQRCNRRTVRARARAPALTLPLPSDRRQDIRPGPATRVCYHGRTPAGTWSRGHGAPMWMPLPWAGQGSGSEGEAARAVWPGHGVSSDHGRGPQPHLPRQEHRSEHVISSPSHAHAVASTCHRLTSLAPR